MKAVMNLEMKTAIRVKNKKDVKRIRELIQAFGDVVQEDFPDCLIWKVVIYDNKETVLKLMSETPAN
jgi:hypothetical protein